MNDGRRILAVIERIYEAAADPEQLGKLATVLASEFNTDSAFLYTCRRHPARMGSVLSATKNFDDWARATYAEYYYVRDEWFARSEKFGIPSVVLGEELIDETSLLRSEWYDYCRKLDAFHVLGAQTRICDDLVGAIGFHRPRSARRFSEADRRRAALILPHLQRALQIRHHVTSLTRERDASLKVVDGLAIGVIVVGAAGSVLFSNPAADRMLRSGRGLAIAGGRLRTRDPRRQGELERLVGEAVQTSAGAGAGAGGVLCIAKPTGPPLTLLVSPFRAAAAGYGPGSPAAIVVFRDPDESAAVSEEALMTAYGLTRKEARLLATLTGGHTLAEYAETAGVSVNTAKTQLRHIGDKMGASRQVDLVRSVLADPAIRLARP